MCETDRNVDINVRVAQKKAQREIITLQEEIKHCRQVLSRFQEHNEIIRRHCEAQLAELNAALEAAKLAAEAQALKDLPIHERLF